THLWYVRTLIFNSLHAKANRAPFRFASCISSTANLRSEWSIILPRGPPRSLGPFFLEVTVTQLPLRLSPYLSILFLIHFFCFFPLLNPDSVVWFEPNYGHWLINIFFSMLQFVLCTILFPGNTLPVHPHSSCTSLKQLKTYLHYSTCLMIDHYQDLRNQLLVLLFASCTRLHQKFQILHKDLRPTHC